MRLNEARRNHEEESVSGSETSMSGLFMGGNGGQQKASDVRMGHCRVRQRCNGGNQLQRRENTHVRVTKTQLSATTAPVKEVVVAALGKNIFSLFSWITLRSVLSQLFDHDYAIRGYCTGSQRKGC